MSIANLDDLLGGAKRRLEVQQPGAAQSTIEALIYDVRDRGEIALRDPSNHRRMAELSDRQFEEVVSRLAKRCAAKPDGVATHVIAQFAAMASR